MKTIGIYLIFLTLILPGCKKNAESDAFLLQTESKFKAGQVYKSQNSDLSVTVKKITDSRCPIGVVCIWAGEASVWLDVSNGQTWEVALSTMHQPVDTVNGFIFKLIDVLPFPKYQVEVPDSEKIVVLQIDKL